MGCRCLSPDQCCVGAKCLQPQQRMVKEDEAELLNKTDDGGAANSPANIPELRTWVVFAAISTITTMSSKHSIYPKWHTQAMGKRNHMEQKTFSFQDGQDGHLPASELSQSWGLHFCVLSGQGSWSQRLLSSSASPVLVLMHLTWRRWMPPPQGAVHCGSRKDLSAWGAPIPVSCRATTAELSPAPQSRPSTTPCQQHQTPGRFHCSSAQSGSKGWFPPTPCSPLPRSPPSRWCRGVCCKAGWHWAEASPHSDPTPGTSPAVPAPHRRTTPSTAET